MQTRSRFALTLCGIAAASMCFALRAQSPAVSAPSKQDPRVRVEADIVLVPVSVSDPAGRLVTGLGLGHFEVLEEGRRQEITRVLAEESPISVALIFDISGSMGGQINGARAMALNFFKTANPQDEFMLVQFKDRARLVSPFTRNFDEMEQSTTFAGAKGSTALLDAVYLAANKLRGASNRRKALVVISDGEDNHSRYSEKDVQQVLREADAQLYAIGGFGGIGYGILEKMVNMTGGRMFGGYAIEDTTSKIWAELRQQYVLVYHPENRARDGKWRKIEVRLRSLPRGMPKLYVNAKSGYLAPN